MTKSRTHKSPSAVPPEFAMDLSSSEGQFVEFKESPSDSLAKEMVAFANAEGGRIYIGITDHKVIKGITISNRLLSQVQDIARHCDPPLTIELRHFKHEGRDLLMVHVPEGKEKPFGCSAGYYLRMGPSSQKLNRNELLDFVRSVDPMGMERRDCKNFVYPKDFNRGAFRTFLKMAQIPTRGVSVESLLLNLELARRQGSHLIVNNACALFFAKKPVRILPQARVTCILYKTPARTEILDRKDLEGGLLENADQAEIFLLRHLRVRYEIKGFNRIDHHEVPIAALREGILNAVIHKDYSIAGANVSMEIDPGRLRITNPGGLPAGLNPNEFGEISIRRNPLIADLFYRVGKVERAGSGIRRIREAVENEHGITPQFKYASFFDLAFPRYGEKEWAALSDQEGSERPSSDPVATQYRPSSDRAGQSSKLLDFCITPRSKQDLMNYLSLSHRPSFRKHYLHPLLKKGFLAMTDPNSPNSPNQKYMTTPKGLKLLQKETKVPKRHANE